MEKNVIEISDIFPASPREWRIIFSVSVNDEHP